MRNDKGSAGSSKGGDSKGEYQNGELQGKRRWRCEVRNSSYAEYKCFSGRSFDRGAIIVPTSHRYCSSLTI
jgi:hypothetical protein